MSNRRRPVLPPTMTADIKRALRCPDCTSDVVIRRTPDGPTAQVHHDDTCPTLRALERQGRGRQIAIVRGTHQAAADFADTVAALATEATRATGRPARITATPYTNLSHGEPAA